MLVSLAIQRSELGAVPQHDTHGTKARVFLTSARLARFRRTHNGAVWPIARVFDACVLSDAHPSEDYTVCVFGELVSEYSCETVAAAWALTFVVGALVLVLLARSGKGGPQ